MRRFFGLVFAAGLLLAPVSRADAQVAVSVGYPAYYNYYGGYGVNINVPGFSFSSGYYPPVYAAPVATAYAPAYYAPYYGVRVAAPYSYYSGYYGYAPEVSVRVGY
jgi:hypothetical protein